MKTKKIAFCGIMAAAATVIMLVGYFPYLTYAVPCVAALAVMVTVIEFGKLYGFMAYLASVLPVFLFCEPETKLIYIFVFGYYPIIKCVYEKFPNRILEYAAKLVSFNLCIFIVYLLAAFVFGVSYDDLDGLGKIGIAVFVIMANLTFIIYDFLITRISYIYLQKLHKSVIRLLKLKR